MQGSVGLENIRVYLYIRGFDRETLFPFLAEFSDLSVTSTDGDYVCLSMKNETGKEEINHLREKMVEELYQDFVAFIEPNSPNFDTSLVVAIMPKLSAGVYKVTEIIPPVVLKNLTGVKQYLKDYYYWLCGIETIETALGFAEAGLNATKASQSLYMHRNTLNYRLDNFTKTTGIDIRTFAGAYALYLLYKS